MKKKKAIVIGARGYSGQQLTQLLLRHPHVEVAGLYATEAFASEDLLARGSKLSACTKRLPQGSAMKDLKTQLSSEVDFAFLATPHEVSWELAPYLIEKGLKVIDLSGAFRLQSSEKAKLNLAYYKGQSPDLPCDIGYGIQPLAHQSLQLLAKKAGNKPLLVANPGCYASAIILGFWPLLKNKLIDPRSLIVDAKSGTTGAGKKPLERLLASEVEGLCSPYRIGNHQHIPEVIEALSFDQQSEANVELLFTPHLMNFRRGIIASLYANLVDGATEAEIQEAFASTYSSDPLIDVQKISEVKDEKYLSLRNIVGTAKTQIAYSLQNRKILIFVLIDNLMKGAASQAIENMNILMGLPASTSLTDLEVTV